MAATTEVSSGVQELIEKLKNQGVTAGREQAGQIVKEARDQAARILSDAKAQAEAMLSDARKKIEIEHTSAQEAMKAAFRDTQLTLRSQFRAAFAAHLKKLVSVELQDKDFVRQLVLVIAGMTKPEIADAPLEIQLPSNLFETDEHGTRLSPEGKERLRHLVLGVSGQLLREGVDLKPSEDFSGGIRVHVVGEDLEIDLTDEALSNLLLKYLLPRYRAIVSGQE
jgi:V/A-type H+/Na+-transporting ATPase subunit E